MVVDTHGVGQCHQADIGGHGGLIVFGDEEVVGAARHHLLGDLALGQQGIGGDSLAADVERFEQRDGHADLIGLLDLVGRAYGQGGDLFWV
ncbi:hypothetical protein CCR96_19545 [Halochromatium roseum]|nr:hypothetical protein [Halochromatium roseum]